MRAMDYLWHKIVVQLQNLALMVIWEIRPKKMVREQFLQGQWTWWILPSFSRPYKDLLKCTIMGISYGLKEKKKSQKKD